MKKNFYFSLFFVSILIGGLHASAQFKATSSDAWKKLYRETPEKVNDLVHTKLDVRFDYQKSYLYGKEWVTLKPHFYTVDTLVLDAKGMNINEVALVRGTTMVPLAYVYKDSMYLHIKLDRAYTRNESYTIYLDYTAKPDEYRANGSAAIRDAKGLYFINPLGKVKDKPIEIWTQGETEASSVWFPTIDKPNQKTTAEINMTVPSKYVTLSNGLLTAQKKINDSTRIDTWKMNQPHSPYLFFMGVGDFTIVKDSYKGKEVSYYVEKDFANAARGIFGLTPEMIGFYSKILGVEYPWDKYSQLVGRDYVSGAMENTTATLHSQFLQQNLRQLTDGNKYEDYIAHELFHQWFGDLVTAESWSNITVNESFANYSEVLWDEYKWGKDAGGKRNYTDMEAYLQGRADGKNLVRFNYRDKEDVFDLVSYQKGGRILNMLRNFVGDSAFFKSLNLYLTRNKFQNGEAQQLRLIFEEVTGKDLNWFWNQWYYSNGHPKLDIKYSYDEAIKKAKVIVTQKQSEDKFFKLPVAIDVFAGGNKTRYNVWAENKSDTFSFSASSKPDLINFDGDKVLLAETEENKTMLEYQYQYAHGDQYADRKEALEYALENKEQTDAKAIIFKALSDPYYDLRNDALKGLNYNDLGVPNIKVVEQIAKTDAKRLNRAAAIEILADAANKNYMDLFTKGATDSSYSVAGASLAALSVLDEAKALALLPELKKDAKGKLSNAIKEVEALTKTDADFDEMTTAFNSARGLEKIKQYKAYVNYLGNVENAENFEKGIDKIVALRNMFGGFEPSFKAEVNQQLQKIMKKKQQKRTDANASVMDAQIAYIDSKLK